MSLNILEKLKF